MLLQQAQSIFLAAEKQEVALRTEMDSLNDGLRRQLQQLEAHHDRAKQVGEGGRERKRGNVHVQERERRGERKRYVLLELASHSSPPFPFFTSLPPSLPPSFPHLFSQEAEARQATLSAAVRTSTQRVDELMVELASERERARRLEGLEEEVRGGAELRQQLEEVRGREGMGCERKKSVCETPTGSVRQMEGLMAPGSCLTGLCSLLSSPRRRTHPAPP